MDTSEMLIQYLISIVLALGLSMAAAYNFRQRTFSMFTFLSSISVAIGILIWTGIIPYYSVVFIALIIAGMFFMGEGESVE